MAGLHYLGKPWQDNPEPPDRDDDELPVNCLECGVELEEGEEILCTACTDEIQSAPPAMEPDSHLESGYDERNGDIGGDGPPF